MLDVIGAGVQGALLQAQTKIGSSPEVKSIEYDTLFQSSSLCKSEMAELESVSAIDPSQQVHVNQADYEKPSHILLWALFKRSSLSSWRDSHTNWGRVVSMAVLGVIFGLIFLQIDDTDFAGVNSKLNAIFYVLGLGGWAQTLLAVPVLMSQRAVFSRERASNSYPAWMYSFCISVVDIPYIAASTMALVLPAYFLIGYTNNAAHFFRFFNSVFIQSLVLGAIGQWSGATFSNYTASMQLTGTLLVLFFLFGGSFKHPSDIQVGWLWLFYVNPIPRAMFACAVDQFRCDAPNPYTNVDECPTIELTNDDQTKTRVTVHNYMNDILDVGYDTYANNIGYLMAMWFFWMACTALSLRYINHLKR